MAGQHLGASVNLRQVAVAACLLFFLAGNVSALRAQSRHERPAPRFIQFGKADQAEGKKIIEDFRSRGLGNGYFDFEFRFMPRRGVDRIVPARMWLGRNPKGPVTRTELFPGDAKREQRLLVENSSSGNVWNWHPTDGIAVAPLAPSALFTPLAETNFSAFDLQMPYLYWTDWVYEGVAKLKGRLADVFLMYPPAGLAGEGTDLTGVRIYIDTQFHALVQSECIGASNTITKTLQVVDFKKVDEQWLIKIIDLRDEKTRDKTRFQVKGAAMGVAAPEGAFDEGSLATSLPGLPAARVRSLLP